MRARKTSCSRLSWAVSLRASARVHCVRVAYIRTRQYSTNTGNNNKYGVEYVRVGMGALCCECDRIWWQFIVAVAVLYVYARIGPVCLRGKTILFSYAGIIYTHERFTIRCSTHTRTRARARAPGGSFSTIHGFDFHLFKFFFLLIKLNYSHRLSRDFFVIKKNQI